MMVLNGRMSWNAGCPWSPQSRNLRQVLFTVYGEQKSCDSNVVLNLLFIKSKSMKYIVFHPKEHIPNQFYPPRFYSLSVSFEVQAIVLEPDETPLLLSMSIMFWLIEYNSSCFLA